MDRIDKKLLTLIQEGIPIDKKPFEKLAKELFITESEVINRIHKLKEDGYIRRMGGIFNSHKLGFKSTLCAMKVPENKIDEVAKLLNSYEEITHNYIREDSYNMWFTVITYSESNLFKLIDDIKLKTGIKDVIDLPSLKLFKVKVALNVGGD
jgi:siroheme decarboxylase